MKKLLVLLLFAVLPVQATTLRWAAQNDILTFDPHSQNHATTLAMLMHVYEGLTRYGKKYEIEPALATDWKQLSPTQWRFNLRQNVEWIEQETIRRALEFSPLKRQAAQTMGISPRALAYYLNKYPALARAHR